MALASLWDQRVFCGEAGDAVVGLEQRVGCVSCRRSRWWTSQHLATVLVALGEDDLAAADVRGQALKRSLRSTAPAAAARAFGIVAAYDVLDQVAFRIEPEKLDVRVVHMGTDVVVPVPSISRPGIVTRWPWATVNPPGANHETGPAGNQIAHCSSPEDDACRLLHRRRLAPEGGRGTSEGQRGNGAQRGPTLPGGAARGLVSERR